MSETTRQPATACIAVGSNLGDRAWNIRAAIEALKIAPDIQVVAVSSLLDNPAVGGPDDSPPFLNAAAKLNTILPPMELLHRLLDIERNMGRVRDRRWEPRIIDLDLLLYEDRIMETPDLILPHPRLHERRFVLQPLAEIAAETVHPVLHRNIGRLLRELDG